MTFGKAFKRSIEFFPFGRVAHGLIFSAPGLLVANLALPVGNEGS